VARAYKSLCFVNGHVLAAGASFWKVDQSSVKVDPGTGGVALVPKLQTRPRSVEQSPRYGPPKFCMRDLPHQDVGECRTLTEFTEGGRGMYRRHLAVIYRVYLVVGSRRGSSLGGGGMRGMCGMQICGMWPRRSKTP
jgi:hypothetical protein